MSNTGTTVELSSFQGSHASAASIRSNFSARTVSTTMADLTRERLSRPARLMAAAAVAKKKWPIAQTTVLLFRLFDFCANVLMLCGTLWYVDQRAVVPFFVLFWYLPAWHRVGSWWKPLRLPLLNFVVDDFSMLGLHPNPRPAKFIHLIYVLRVFILAVAVPALAFSSWEAWFEVFANRNAVDIFNCDGKRESECIPPGSKTVWKVAGLTSLALTYIWLLGLTALLLLAFVKKKGPLSWEKDKDSMKRIDRLAEHIDLAAAHADWRTCVAVMKKLRSKHPSLKLTTIGTTMGPSVAWIVHLLLDISVAYTFFSHGWPRRHKDHPEHDSYLPDMILGGLTVLNFGMVLWHTARVAGSYNPFLMFPEARASFLRGVFTERFVDIVYSDLGFHVLPTLFINAFGLPFRADSVFKLVGAVWAILLTVFSSVPFIFQQFDLGVEREGLAQEQRVRLTTADQRAMYADRPVAQIEAASSAEVERETVRNQIRERLF